MADAASIRERYAAVGRDLNERARRLFGRQKRPADELSLNPRIGSYRHISGGDAVVFADPLGMRGLYGGEHHGIGPEQMQQ
jgi:hypothetical protein